MHYSELPLNNFFDHRAPIFCFPPDKILSLSQRIARLKLFPQALFQFFSAFHA